MPKLKSKGWPKFLELDNSLHINVKQIVSLKQDKETLNEVVLSFNMSGGQVYFKTFKGETAKQESDKFSLHLLGY